MVVTISAETFSFRPPLISNASADIILSITVLTCTAVKSSNGSSRLQEKVPPSAHLNDIHNMGKSTVTTAVLRKELSVS